MRLPFVRATNWSHAHYIFTASVRIILPTTGPMCFPLGGGRGTPVTGPSSLPGGTPVPGRGHPVQDGGGGTPVLRSPWPGQDGDIPSQDKMGDHPWEGQDEVPPPPRAGGGGSLRLDRLRRGRYASCRFPHEDRLVS